jgi:hypothetical protein
MCVGYIFSGLVSLSVAILAYVIQSLIKENRRLRDADRIKEEALAEGVTCLLRVKLIEYHSKYTQVDRVSSHGYENWFEMYHAYKGLGGNGMVEHMKEEMEELHIKN